MRHLANLAAIGALALLAGCASAGSGRLTPAQTLFAIEGGVTEAITAAQTYKALPPCAPGLVACSDPAIVARIDAAAPAAQAAILAAEPVVTSKASTADQVAAALAAAQQALAALQAALPPTSAAAPRAALDQLVDRVAG